MELKDYLLKDHSPETVKIYLRDIDLYQQYLKEEVPTATYQQVMDYVTELRKKYSNPRTINRMLYGVKAYYFWLCETGQRTDHPCRYLRLKDAKNLPIQLQDLFSSQELGKLMERKERYPSVEIKNKTILGLLIYQGLRLSELVNLKTADIDLEAGTVEIKESRKAASRTLKLQPEQIMVLYRYLNGTRPKLMKTKTDKLIINLKGNPEKGEGINYLVSTFKHQFPTKNLNCETIRQSVIANLLKEGKELRAVQTFAGHKKVSSTEKYRQTGLEELKAAITRYHPLG